MIVLLFQCSGHGDITLEAVLWSLLRRSRMKRKYLRLHFCLNHEVCMICDFNCNIQIIYGVKNYFLHLITWFEHILLCITQLVQTQVLTTYKVFTTKQTICTKTYNCWIIIITIVVWKDTNVKRYSNDGNYFAFWKK